MKVDREKLIGQLNILTPGLSSGDILEQSSCFIFRNNRVYTFNEETSCSVDTELNIEVAVAAIPLLNLLKKMPDKELDIEIGDGSLDITGNKRQAGVTSEKEIKLLLKVDMPTDWVKIPDDLMVAIDMSCQCTSNDADKFELTCVHFTPTHLEASDDYQLIRYKLNTGMSDSLVRHTVLEGVSGMIPVEFAETKEWLHFRNALGMVMSCRRYTDKYPPIEHLLSFDAVKSSIPDGASDIVERAGVFVENSRGRLLVELRTGKLRISGLGDVGYYRETADVEYEGNPFKFMMSPKLLSDVVKRSKFWELAPGRLKISTDKWIYVSAIGRAEVSA